MRRLLSIGLALAAALWTQGCGNGGSQYSGVVTSPSGDLEVVRGQASGISWEVRGRGDESQQQSSGERIEASAGNNTLVIEVDGLKVTANGQRYGTLQPGDSILLDENGWVSVNGQKRSPQ
jgi:hypothetical protein